MNRRGRRASIPRGPRSFVGSALVAAMCCASLMALDQLLVPGRWSGAGVATILGLAAVTAAVRSITRSWWAPTLAGALIGALGLLIAYGGPPGRIQVLPGTDSVGRLVDQVHEAFSLIDAGFVPVAATRPIELLLVAGAAVVLLVADLLALGIGVPAWSALVPLLLWLPGIGLGFPAPTRALGWTALAYLLLLALSAAPLGARDTRTRRTGWTVAAAAGLVVASLSAGPLVAAAPGWASISLPDFGTGPVGPLRLSDDLDLRESLGQRSGQVVLRYTVTDPTGSPAPSASADGRPAPLVADARLVGPLRAFTLQSFDGRSWKRAGTSELAPWASDRLLSSDAGALGRLPDPAAGTLARVDVTIEALREQRLPISTFPRTVEVRGPWLYDASRDEVIGDDSTRQGQAYSMTVQVPGLTAAELRTATGPALADATDFLAVPSTDHTDEILALAKEITADANGRYEQALALQQYFRDARNFTYDTRIAAGQSDDAVWDFLGTRRGYCVQFATSMTIMARLLGIPARLGVGFLPGVPDQDRVYTVTGKQAHAWPELYFPGDGWVRFEPTPAIQTGAPPQWSDPFAASTAAPVAPVRTAAPSSAGTALPSVSSAPVAPETSAQHPASRLVVGAGAALVLLLVVGSVVLLRRRGRREVPLDPETAWARLRDRLRPAEIVWSDARTPRQAAALVRERTIELRGSGLGEQAAAALDGLARAVERARYAPAGTGESADQLEGWVGQVLTDVAGGLSDRPGRDDAASARPGGTSGPPSAASAGV